MKRAKHMLALAVILCMVLLCCSCAGNKMQTSEHDDAAAGQTAYVERDGITGVVLEDCTLTDCIVMADKDIGISSVPQRKIVEKMGNYDIHAGDIILVLNEQDGRMKVAIPHGDPPHVHGYLSSKIVSTKKTDIENGNQARVIECMTYDTPNGNELGEMSAGVQILSRERGWCQIEPLGTGETLVWVQLEQLSFDFDQSVLDTAE